MDSMIIVDVPVAEMQRDIVSGCCTFKNENFFFVFVFLTSEISSSLR